MAVQQWTIVKLVGPASADAMSHWRLWCDERRSNDRSVITADDWPRSTRRAASAYLARLLKRRDGPPVVYFSQHIDLWLAAGDIDRHLPNAPAMIMHDTGQLWCYPLPDRGRLVRRNASIARSPQMPENGWLAQRLIEAARAYEKLWPTATLLLSREPITASPSDETLLAKAQQLPKWLRQPPTR